MRNYCLPRGLLIDMWLVHINWKWPAMFQFLTFCLPHFRRAFKKQRQFEAYWLFSLIIKFFFFLPLTSAYPECKMFYPTPSMKNKKIGTAALLIITKKLIRRIKGWTLQACFSKLRNKVDRSKTERVPGRLFSLWQLKNKSGREE